MKQIVVLSGKGGTGKTTTAINLAAGLARAGQRVLVVDMDTQGQVAKALGRQDLVPDLRALLDSLDRNTRGAALDAVQAQLSGLQRELDDRGDFR